MTTLADPHEPKTRISAALLRADVEGTIDGKPAGEVLLSLAYLFGQAGLTEVASSIIDFALRERLPAFAKMRDRKRY